MVRQLQSVDAHRNFDADADDLPDEGPTFDLGGETFHCVPAPAGGTLARLAAAIGRDERGRQVYNLPDMTLFIEDCLIDETTTITPAQPARDDHEAVEEQVVVEDADDIERWRTLMSDKKRPIPVKKLADITIWLSNWYSDRPTQPSRR